MDKPSKIYLRAANFCITHNEWHAGCALDRAGQPDGGNPSAPMQAAFEDLFLGWRDERLVTQQGTELALALLLMSEIAKDSE